MSDRFNRSGELLQKEYDTRRRQLRRRNRLIQTCSMVLAVLCVMAVVVIGYSAYRSVVPVTPEMTTVPLPKIGQE